MIKRVLYIATSDIHISTFHLPYLKWLSENNCEVHLVVENRGDLSIPYVNQFYNLPFPRSPFNLTNYSSYKKLKDIINDNHYDLIHCHTPIPSVLARLAAINSRSTGTKVLYTSHGFHFYKGGPIKYWLSYYPLEYLLSKFTDGIITINAEDYSYINGKMKHKNSFYIKGIGINTDKFKTSSEPDKVKLRSSLGYNKDEFILLYIGEFIYRKNHQFIIESLPELINNIPNIKVIFAGKGILLNKMISLSKKINVDRYIDFLGFTDNVESYAGISDIGISSSRQEGLGLGLAEQMLCSVPIVATLDRGHKEMIIHGRNGYMFQQGNRNEFVLYIDQLYKDHDLRNRMGEEAFLRAQTFTIDKSIESMVKIFNHYLFNK